MGEICACRILVGENQNPFVTTVSNTVRYVREVPTGSTTDIRQPMLTRGLIIILKSVNYSTYALVHLKIARVVIKIKTTVGWAVEEGSYVTSRSYAISI